MYEKINKIPKFYMIFAREIAFFPNSVGNFLSLPLPSIGVGAQSTLGGTTFLPEKYA